MLTGDCLRPHRGDHPAAPAAHGGHGRSDHSLAAVTAGGAAYASPETAVAQVAGHYMTMSPGPVLDTIRVASHR